ncbi:phage tail tube protein [Brevibacillus parabrevis]|uniref:phage tail tube protein n=1 Tax=Brevibacillus parabrevis TaxID=54914 RepID=UPI001C21BF8C|nr:phage tail tube protein [Brevibacillus parabrevis]MBU8715392.1 phage tail tube protein [Brevibacillus parabrevis]
MPVLDSTRTISGKFGEVWMDGEWLSNFHTCEATVDIQYEKVKRSGKRADGNKVVGLEYNGTISGYKITSELARKVAQVLDDRKGAFVCEIIVKLDDPEAYGYERVRLKGVQFTKIDVIKFEHGSIVEEEWPFLYDGPEWLNPITAN